MEKCMKIALVWLNLRRETYFDDNEMILPPAAVMQKRNYNLQKLDIFYSIHHIPMGLFG